MATKAVSGVSMDRFSQLARAYETAKNRADSIRVKADEQVEHIVRTLEIGAASYAFGAVNGYFGPVDFFGIPMELGVSLGATAGAFLLGDKSKAAPHLRAIGDAALAGWSYKEGNAMGKEWGAKADKNNDRPSLPEGKDNVSGELPSRGTGAKLTDEERKIIDQITG